MRKIKFKYPIQGDNWTITVLKTKKFQKKYGAGASGLTIFNKKAIILDKSELCLELIKHELWHAYLSNQLVKSANLKIHQFEEVTAEMFETHGERIIKQSKELFKYIKKRLK